MHKKYSRHGKRELHRNHSTRKVYVNIKKEKEGSVYELKVPQNSKCEINNHCGDCENKENQKLKHKHREKHKHEKHERGKGDEHHKKHEKRSSHTKLEHSENRHTSKHREKSAKRPKHEEKSHSTEKKLIELHKPDNHKTRHRSRSYSVESSEYAPRHKDRHMRREKTAPPEDLKRHEHLNAQVTQEEKGQKKLKETGDRKHKHNKQKDQNKEKAVEHQVMYCHINTETPFKKSKKANDETNVKVICGHSRARNEKYSNKMRRSSSRDVNGTLCDEATNEAKEKSSRNEIHSRKGKRHSDPIKYSPRKSKKKEHVKNIKDQRSTVSLGPYKRYFVLEKSSQVENTRHLQEKKRHRRNRDDEERNPDETRESRRKRKCVVDDKLVEREGETSGVKQEQIRETIEDDLKSYFTKIQSLIDKKLDHILHSTNKEEKIVIKDDKQPQRASQKNSPERNDEKTSRQRSRSKKEKKKDKNVEDKECEHKKKGHRSRALENQKYIKNIDNESRRHKRNKTPKESDKPKSPARFVLAVDEEQSKRQRSPKPQPNLDKLSSDRLINLREAKIVEVEHKPKSAHRRSSKSPKVYQRADSSNRRELYAQNADNVEPPTIECRLKESKRRLHRAMNLECKTVSIIGIAPQIKDSTVSQAQSCSSLNALAAEEGVEKKKQSKRFKLYYKYSVADNKCTNSGGSGHSSDRKSVVSDSYRMMSDNSDERRSDKLENTFDVNVEEPTKDTDEVVFVMKKEHVTKNFYRSIANDANDQRSRKYKPPEATKLNNILEESSNVSMYSKVTNELNCKYFKVLNTSSSDCNLQIISRKPTFSDCNVTAGKHKPLVKYPAEKIPFVRACPKKVSPERNHLDDFPEDKPDRRSKDVDKRADVKPQAESGKCCLKSQRATRDFRNKYNSKSDIDVSYDALRVDKDYSIPKNPKEYRHTDLRKEIPSRDRYSPKGTPRKNSAERVVSRKEEKRILEELIELRNAVVESRGLNVNHLVHDIGCDTRKKSSKNVSRIPSLIKKHTEKSSSRVQFPEISSTQYARHNQNEQKILTNTSCQSNFKELVDVGVEVNTITEGCQCEAIACAKKKTFPKKTAEAAVEAKVIRAPKPVTYLSRGRFSKFNKRNLPQTSEVGVEACLPFIYKEPTPVVDLEKKTPNKSPKSTPKSKWRTPRSTSLSSGNQKSDLSRERESLEPEIKIVRPETRKSTTITETDTCNKCGISHSQEALRDSDRLQTHVRSTSCSEKSRRNGSSLRSSKSELNVREIKCKPVREQKSSLCFDKFTDNSTPLKTNSTSLDQYAIKSIISDNPHASRLFLTKDFSREINSYQRRKMYDEAIRQKFRTKVTNKGTPQVFEVRYLTLEQELMEKRKANNNASCRLNQNRSKLPTYTCNSKASKNNFRKKPNLKSTSKKSLRSVNKKPSDGKMNLSSSRNPYGSVVTDVDQLNKFRKKQFPDKSVEELFVKDRPLNDHSLSNMFSYCKQLADIQSSSLIIKDSVVDDFCENSLKLGEASGPDPHFMQLIDCLCKSIANYCQSRLTVQSREGVESPRNNKLTSDTNCEENESQEEKPCGVTRSLKTVKFRENGEESPATIEYASPRSVLSSHVSCPALADTPSSFEFLYEEEEEVKKEDIIADLTKPMDTILGYALNDNRSVFQAEVFEVFKKKLDQISNTATESGESGYFSNSSKRFSSVTSFFKKPNIAALLKPASTLHNDDSNNSLTKEYSHTDYPIMMQKCHEYAQKVRSHSDNKSKLEEEFEEIPLSVLLGKQLQSFNSKCSLCKEISQSEIDDLNKIDLAPSESSSSLDAIDVIRSDESSVHNENDMETLIYYGNKEREPSLEIIKLNKIQPKKSITNICCSASQGVIECQVVLSNTNLNRCSLTIIEDSQSEEMKGAGDCNKEFRARSAELSQTRHEELRSALHKSESRLSNIISSTLMTNSEADLAKEIFSDNELAIPLGKSPSAQWPPNSSDARKTLAKKFFENLLQVYDKEVTVTTQLFQDEDFFVNHLLASLEDTPKQALSSKGKQKFRDIRGKLKDCIEKVFSTKVSGGCSSEEDEDKVLSDKFEKVQQEKLKILAYDARRYFSLFVQAVRVNKNINDEMKIFGLLKLLERIENGDFSILRKEEDVNFEEEIKEQVKEGFLNVYKASVKEAKKCKRSLTPEDLKLIRAFICKYRIGLLSKTDLIATYIGRGLFKTESQLRAAVNYLVRSQTTEIDLKDFEDYCNVCTNCKN